ncbi:MAG TPA: S-adenosylmethionine:tRNA ribosyltransferase-isomerase, partial [bacterium]|nr:S-adenosylmethionine:tRNA ribosyltransferase-isomerase [bacterium]
MRIEELDYPLPEAAIAQEPAAERDRARLLILDRASGRMAEAAFADLPDRLAAGSLLVLNDSRVRPARLRFTKASGGRLE